MPSSNVKRNPLGERACLKHLYAEKETQMLEHLFAKYKLHILQINFQVSFGALLTHNCSGQFDRLLAGTQEISSIISSIITPLSSFVQVARSSPTTAVTAQSAPRTLCMRSGLYQG